jgi:hypothetical protein
VATNFYESGQKAGRRIGDPECGSWGRWRFSSLDLPGEQFRIVPRELLSDTDQLILPRGFVSREFEILVHVACLVIEHPSEALMSA